MTIPTFNPQISVTLIKNIDRQQGTAARYQKAARAIDLTPYLGDGATISTSKDIYDPEGRWQISFSDQMDPTTQDTFYALIEPMDVIEIRGTRTAGNYGGKLPLIMRGFVGPVRRAESMSPDSPQRNVTVSGTDWGKLWKIHGVWMEVALAQEKPLLTTFQLQAAIGMSAQLMNVGDFMKKVTTEVVNRKIQEMYGFTQPLHLPQFSCTPPAVQGQVAPQAVGGFPAGPFWNLVKAFSDAPWNELWIDDSDAVGPVLVFRPTPFKDLTGRFIGDATDPGSVPLDYADVVSIEVGRSDEHCANFFWTPPGMSMLSTPNGVAAYDILAGNPFDFKHPNNEPGLYGYRKMEWPTQLIPNDVADYPLKQLPDQQNQSSAGYRQWHIDRGNLMRDMNRDNVVLEDGVIVARGREDFRPGKYLAFTRGKVASEFYVTRVSHSIQPFGSWTSALAVERGTGFLVRNKLSGSPFYLEGRPGVFGADAPSAGAGAAPAASPDASGGTLV